MICRPAGDDDLAFIIETFVRSIRGASTHVEGLDGSQVGGLLKNLLAKGWSPTVVEEENYLIGWAVHDRRFSAVGRNRLAWIYLRETMRGQGVAKFLLAHIGVDPRRPITTPFAANRNAAPGIRFHLRPFECLPL